MKLYFTLIAVLSAITAFSQQNGEEKDTMANGNYTKVTQPMTNAYINGTRIDLLDAVYARFISRANGEVIFDYGQSTTKFRNDILTDKKGLPLVFLNTRIPFLLNFFHNNHWDLAVAPSFTEQTDWYLKRTPNP